VVSVSDAITTLLIIRFMHEYDDMLQFVNNYYISIYTIQSEHESELKFVLMTKYVKYDYICLVLIGHEHIIRFGTSPMGAVAKYCNDQVCVCVCVCLSLCLFANISPESRA